MLSIAHTLIALPFAVYLDNPIIIFVAAFVFHIFSDTFLHWNIFPQDYKGFPYHIVALDVLGGLVLAWLIIGNAIFTWPFLIAIAGSNAPDVFHSLWLIIQKGKYQKILSWAKPFFNFHDHLQIETHDIKKGLVFQILFSIIAVYLVL